jgi:hypothetical protein
MPKSQTRPKASAPWWLSGEEECPHCHHLYAYELEVRCTECDGPSCPHCVSRLELGVVCIHCSQNPQATEETSHG